MDAIDAELARVHGDVNAVVSRGLLPAFVEPHPCKQVGAWPIGKWKKIDREMEVVVLIRVARRLTDRVIERSTTRPARHIQHAVENHPSLFVGVKSLIDKMAKEAATLGTAVR